MNKSLFFGFLFLGLVACKTSIDPSELEGTWRVVKFSADMPTISEELIQAGEKEALSSVYQLLSDGSSIITSESTPDGRIGTWQLERELSQLMFDGNVDYELGPETYIVVNVSGSSMKWRQDIDNLGILQMTLKKD